MKHTTARPLFAAARWLAALLALPLAHATVVLNQFQVTINTSPLQNSPAGPFSLDFQLTDGSGTGDGNNTVTVDNFNFHGGSWTGSSPAPIVLKDTSFFVDYYQEFTPGTGLSMHVTMTPATDSGSTPDQFSISILDKNLAPMATWDLSRHLNPNSTLITVDITSTTPTVQQFTLVPEAPVGGALAGVLGGLALWLKLRRSPRLVSAA